MPCDDKENFPVQLFLRTDQIQCSEVVINIPNNTEEVLQDEMDVDHSINNYEVQSNTNILNKENESNRTIYCDDGMDITEIIPSTLQNSEFNDTAPITQTIESIPKEVADNLPSSLCKIFVPVLNESQLNFNTPSNFTQNTQAISAVLAVGCLNNLANQNKLNNESCNTELYKNNINCSKIKV